jgi:hypothetical protein
VTMWDPLSMKKVELRGPLKKEREGTCSPHSCPPAGLHGHQDKGKLHSGKRRDLLHSINRLSLRITLTVNIVITAA